jgi:hypothetical protein
MVNQFLTNKKMAIGGARVFLVSLVVQGLLLVELFVQFLSQ